MDPRPPPEADTPRPELRLGLLGGFVASVDGVELPPSAWPALRASQLVQLLALQPGHRLNREQVMDALWPQLDPEAASANLRKALHHARQALARHDGIVVQGGALQLWPAGPVSTDAEHFEHQAREALASGDVSACAQAALGYGGELLPGARYDPWTQAARERLLARMLELLRASAQWEALVGLDPVDEPAYHALMWQALEAGNRAGALRWYARLREALQQTLGALPDARTEALYARCTAGLAAPRPPFVGRALPMAQLAAWLALPADRRPGALVVQGEAGLGKSALCEELVTRALGQGWSSCAVPASDSDQPYAWTTALAEHCLLRERGVLDRIGAPARAVIAQLSSLAAPAAALAGPLGRHQVVGAVRRLLVSLAGEQGLLLWVDDAQGLGDADAEVLVQLAMAGAPVCVLLALRAAPAGSALARGLARLRRLGVLQAQELEPLDEAECRRLVGYSAAQALSEQAVTELARAADGNPFAAIELAQATRGDPSHPLAANLAQAITARLCDVPGDALALLRWLALCPRRLDTRLIEALAATAQVPLPGTLDGLLSAGALVPDGGHYRFRHELVRRALSEQIAPHRRLKMHRLIAQCLGQQDAPPADVAAHWRLAACPREALPWSLQAARDAMRLAAFGDALHHLGPVLASEARHAEALRLRAEALDALGEPAALAAYRLAADVAGEPDCQDLRAKAALAQVKQGDPKGALQALAGVHPTSVEGRLCEALAYSGAAALGATDPALGTAKSAIARRLALESGDRAALVIASWAQAAAAHARGELHQSVWADLHETHNVPHLALRVFDGHLCITQRFLYGARPYAEVIAFADALAHEARRLGASRGQAFGTTLRGEAEWLAGDLQAAHQHLSEGARLHRAIGGAVGEALSLQRLAELMLHEGQRERARELLDEALDLARQTDIGFHLLDRIYGTRIRLYGDDPQQALHMLADASASVRGPLETCPGCRITFAVPAAIAAARAGAIDLALQHEAQCAYLADVVMRLPAWHAAHEEVRGHIAQARGGNPSEARARFAGAASRFREAGHPIDAQRCEQLACG